MYAGIVCVMLGIGATYITVAIGVAYPCFMSFIALESDGGEDDKQWLTYWVVFGLLNIVDHFAGFILAFIPILGIKGLPQCALVVSLTKFIC